MIGKSKRLSSPRSRILVDLRRVQAKSVSLEETLYSIIGALTPPGSQAPQHQGIDWVPRAGRPAPTGLHDREIVRAVSFATTTADDKSDDRFLPHTCIRSTMMRRGGGALAWFSLRSRRTAFLGANLHKHWGHTTARCVKQIL